jgi:hypothetical protein
MNKVNNWLKTVATNQQPSQYPASASGASLAPSDPSLSRTSPRSSSRYYSSGVQQQAKERSSGYPHGVYNMSQSFTTQYSSVDYHSSRPSLQQQQQQQQHGPAINSRGLMTSSTSMLGAGNLSMTSSGNVQQDSKVFTTVVYRFPQEKDEMPYRVKIHSANPTLADIKVSMPKKANNYRFYFKTKVDGEACFEHETNEAAVVPLWEGGSIVVHCRND